MSDRIDTTQPAPESTDRVIGNGLIVTSWPMDCEAAFVTHRYRQDGEEKLLRLLVFREGFLPPETISMLGRLLHDV